MRSRLVPYLCGLGFKAMGSGKGFSWLGGILHKYKQNLALARDYKNAIKRDRWLVRQSLQFLKQNSTHVMFGVFYNYRSPEAIHQRRRRTYSWESDKDALRVIFIKSVHTARRVDNYSKAGLRRCKISRPSEPFYLRLCGFVKTARAKFDAADIRLAQTAEEIASPKNERPRIIGQGQLVLLAMTRAWL